MKKGLLKKILLTMGSVFVLLVLVLCIHIYLVTRPKAPDEHTIVMARIDIRQQITDADAVSITNWLYSQKGVDHVVCNAQMDNVVFTYRPVKGDVNEIVSNFKSVFNYTRAERFVPSEKDLAGGCPVSSTSYSYSVYNFFKHTF
jgi:hypothetical protein